MQVLTQNGKMKKSSQNGIDIYNFGIPAFMSQTGIKTCPNAGVCATGCYARSGTYRFGNVVNAYEERLKLTQHPKFADILNAEIGLKYLKSEAKGNQCLIRIHDSGDFYSLDYWLKWRHVILLNPNVKFYAYTKMVELFKSQNDIPSNFTLIYSYGGLQDKLIDRSKDRHSMVFSSDIELRSQGYADASNDDLVAALGPNHRIGLVYHGVKKFDNTRWGKVK